MKNVKKIKDILNKVLGLANLRIVSAKWGPRGFTDTFKRIRKKGIIPSQIVDVGASRGIWTLECMSVFPDSSYFLIDPLEGNRPYLEKFENTNPLVKVWKGALGSNTGYLPFYIHGDQSSFLESEYSKSSVSHSQKIEIRSLDSFLDSTLKFPDLIKLDVQGYELEVLKGAEKCLDSAEILLLEVSFCEIYKGCPLAHEVISFLGKRGFQIFDICTYAQRPYDGELCQSDMVFAKKDSQLFSHKGYE